MAVVSKRGRRARPFAQGRCPHGRRSHGGHLPACGQRRRHVGCRRSHLRGRVRRVPAAMGHRQQPHCRRETHALFEPGVRLRRAVLLPSVSAASLCGERVLRRVRPLVGLGTVRGRSARGQGQRGFAFGRWRAGHACADAAEWRQTSERLPSETACAENRHPGAPVRGHVPDGAGGTQFAHAFRRILHERPFVSLFFLRACPPVRHVSGIDAVHRRGEVFEGALAHPVPWWFRRSWCARAFSCFSRTGASRSSRTPSHSLQAPGWRPCSGSSSATPTGVSAFPPSSCGGRAGSPFG